MAQYDEKILEKTNKQKILCNYISNYIKLTSSHGIF